MAKVELEPQVTMDIYTTVPTAVRMFLYLPDITSASSVTFSSRFESEAELLASLRGSSRVKIDQKLQALSERLESLRHLSTRLTDLKEIGASEGEEKLIKAVKRETEALPTPEELEITPKKKGILEVVKGFLPRRKEKVVKEPSDEPEVKKERRIKTVTQIQRKKGKK